MKRVSLFLTILFSSASIAIAVGHFVNKNVDSTTSRTSDSRLLHGDSAAPGIPAYFNAPPDPPPGIIVKANGNVGIGTRTPAFKLDVSGHINGQGNGSFSGSVTGNSFIKTGGSASQFLKADGSVDGNNYQVVGNVVNGASFNSISSVVSIPFNVFTDFYTFPWGGAGIYFVTIGLDNQLASDWLAAGMFYSSGNGAGTFQIYNSSLVVIALNGMTLRVKQTGTSPSINLNLRVMKMQ